ncbi:hypothetical protein GPECTOR_6g780 [Gonium pectorale]|uniref:Peptidase S9 prolyl oligopeptidase catalytic domain-containing protein n=1 Tax=Gonium pectorale TaxID=33097 RepID=A0A150GVX6_GONPE|nr:hypothetical protein GPECTOR_6g780 [Gonium pectorale]|eukprot:KXZ53862.1 hypothetical protein GPECTOR_6g780 [Gonium pectorale]
MGNRGSKQRLDSKQQNLSGLAPREAPLGEWESPITSAFITEKAVKLGNPYIRPSDGSLFWLEGRPEEGGRQVLVLRSPDGTTRDVTPPFASGFNVRTTVHEYGGGEYCVADDTVFFSNFKDQALYAQNLSAPGSEPRLVTQGSEARGERFADAVWDAPRQRLVAVSELHRDPSTGAELEPGRVVNRLVAIDVASGAVAELVAGADFFSSPRISPDGRWLAWVQWDFPNMPWDHTTLFVAPLQPDGSLGPHTRLAGGERGGSAVQQPRWAPDSSHLYFIDDKSGWWNLYRCRTPRTVATGTAGAAWPAGEGGGSEALHPMEADWGFPAWTLDHRSYEVLSDGSVVALFSDPAAAGASLGLLRPGGPAAGAPWQLLRINTGFTSFGAPTLAVRQLPDHSLTLAAAAGAPTRVTAVVSLTAASPSELAGTSPSDWQSLRLSKSGQVPDGYLSVPEALSYPTTFDDKPATAYMLYYPPTNKDFTYPPGVLPPLLVKSHGGPTSAAAAALNPTLQYWTSRGFAVADIDYGGSTGYGREYRNRLNGRWGVVDVQDCCAAAEWLAAAGRVDRSRLCISGGSAGGFTTLACLAFRKTFAAGASLYGVADVRLLAEHTHKFESRYMDMLVGPLPEAAAEYDARSPIKHPDGFTSPVIFFQGDEDKIVPPEQAIVMHDAVKAAGLPTALVMFKGEQHGFRQAASIRTALDGEMYFYGSVLGFPASMPDDLPKIEIENLLQSPTQ